MSQFQEALMHDYRLTTAEIIYHLPDHPHLLQSYIWQEFDIQPNFPRLTHFLEFWLKSLDGKIHSVRVAYGASLISNQFHMPGFEARLQ